MTVTCVKDRDARSEAIAGGDNWPDWVVPDRWASLAGAFSGCGATFDGPPFSVDPPADILCPGCGARLAGDPLAHAWVALRERVERVAAVGAQSTVTAPADFDGPNGRMRFRMVVYPRAGELC
ncbi:MAG: hypothetical protein HY719_01430 [Planctomycetes bacterium]|nr:hypothetical protein [Planctomycetota bacterium]